MPGSLSQETGIAVVIVEQQVDKALGYAERALVLDHGAVVHSGDAASLLNALIFFGSGTTGAMFRSLAHSRPCDVAVATR